MFKKELDKRGVNYGQNQHINYIDDSFDSVLDCVEELVKNIAYEPVLGVVFTITCGNSDIVEICKDEETANRTAYEMQEKDNYNSYWVDRRELK